MLDTPEESQDTSQSRSQQTDPQQPSSGRSISPDESPELLRWRADILLDEMMLGAVDIASGRPKAASSDPAAATTEAGAFEGGPRPSPTERRSYADGGGASHKQTTDREPEPDPWLAGRSSPSDLLGRSFPQAPSSQSAQAQDYPVGVSPGSPPEPSERMLRPPSASTAMSDAQAEIADPFVPPSTSGGGAGTAGRRVGVLGSVEGKRNLRSNLLPRESQFDARSHFQEIDRLEAEVDATLPTEHEWSVRGRHLLAKATDILQNSPDRSAEVDYYLQQVRSILERAQQTYRWSLVYTKRLKLYLAGWALLSVVVILGCLLYAEPLADTLVDWFPAMTIYGVQNLIASMVSIFAGTMGASVGALRNMFVYRSAGRGYVDRKYSLRGLLLPLMAGLFGFLVYLLFGVIYYVADIYPMQNLLVVGVPALLAFAFGLAQESLYGTTG